MFIDDNEASTDRPSPGNSSCVPGAGHWVLGAGCCHSQAKQWTDGCLGRFFHDSLTVLGERTFLSVSSISLFYSLPRLPHQSFNKRFQSLGANILRAIEKIKFKIYTL